nr:hypothetical protein [uncultured Cupriavidus sp.]
MPSIARVATWAACLLTCATVWAAPPDFVYIGGAGPHPDAVFANGFPAPGTNEDIIAHITGQTCATGQTVFVSTTASEAFAYERALYAMMSSPVPETYVYRIRADDGFYESAATLRATRSYGSHGQFIALAERFEHQQEWLAHGGVRASLVESVQIYRRNAANQIEYRGERRNPNYVAAETQGTNRQFPVQTPIRDRTMVLTPSRSYAAVSACFSCTRNTSDNRDQRSAQTNGSDGQCEVFSVSTDDRASTVIDPFSGEKVQRYVPWKTWRRSNYSSTFESPQGCLIIPGSRETRALKVDCMDLTAFDQFSVHLGAGGSRYTWVDKRFDDGLADRAWIRLVQEIPVKGTVYSLFDYGYSPYWVFSGNDRNWWSGITVIPVYPKLPHPTSDICLYRDEAYSNRIDCLPWNAVEPELRVGAKDHTSSISAAEGQRYRVCDHANFHGRCIILSGGADIRKLRSLRLNDKITSIRACRKPAPSPTQLVPNNRGVIGNVYFHNNFFTATREYFMLKRSVYGRTPEDQKDNEDWIYLKDYDEC